jgi:outer membrane lipoprotein SlyB
VTGFITQAFTRGFCAFVITVLAGCSPDYSPNTYNGSAMQQANKVDTGVVIGYREVKISDDGTIGAVTGGAAGGILGAEMGSPAVPTALAVLSGTVVGGVVGSSIQHATGDTTGWEYIVREPKGDLVSVTQRQPTPIAIGQRVLVIEGKQARIVPDYATAPYDTPPMAKAEEKHDTDKPAAPGNALPTAVTPAIPAAAPAAAVSPPAAPSPDANAAPAAATPDAAANAPSAPLSAAKDQTPSATPAGAPAIQPAAQAAPPPAADMPPPASAGSSSNTPPPPS